MSDRNYDALLAAQNAAQLEKLCERQHHGSLRISVAEAYLRMRDEIREVDGELCAYDDACPHDRSGQLVALKALRREFADVCNYGGMGIMECNRLIAEIKRGIDEAD